MTTWQLIFLKSDVLLQEGCKSGSNEREGGIEIQYQREVHKSGRRGRERGMQIQQQRERGEAKDANQVAKRGMEIWQKEERERGYKTDRRGREGNANLVAERADESIFSQILKKEFSFFFFLIFFFIKLQQQFCISQPILATWFQSESFFFSIDYTKIFTVNKFHARCELAEGKKKISCVMVGTISSSDILPGFSGKD